MKVLLMGPVGSGKGTQGEMISAQLGIPLISVGQVLRDISPSHPWHSEINQALVSGHLAPQDKVAGILKQTVSGVEYESGYIMDGWARNKIDLEYFDPKFDKVIYINIPPEISVSRLATRRTCGNCGAVYNIVTMPPKVDGICDKCGGELRQRSDDRQEAILKRLEIFEKETKPVIANFRSQGILVEVDGSGTPQVVFEEVKKHL